MATKVNLNRATVDDLINNMGIGRKAAENIVNYRNNNGKIKHLDDLQNISGIDDTMKRKIKQKAEV